MTLGNGLSHSILRSYQGDVAEAKRMILAFEDERLKILTEIDSLTPNAAKAAERSEQQNVLAGQILLLEEMTYKLDSALEVVRQILKDRIDLSSKMREGTALLEFDGRIDLDEQRFEHLLQTLPAHMARETERWAMWFLGAEDDRAPYVIHGGEAVLPETLHSANAFRTGDCPSLTARERHDVESIISSEVVHPPGYEELAVRMPGAEAPEVPVGKVQWGLLRP